MSQKKAPKMSMQQNVLAMDDQTVRIEYLRYAVKTDDGHIGHEMNRKYFELVKTEYYKRNGIKNG